MILDSKSQYWITFSICLSKQAYSPILQNSSCASPRSPCSYPPCPIAAIVTHSTASPFGKSWFIWFVLCYAHFLHGLTLIVSYSLHSSFKEFLPTVYTAASLTFIKNISLGCFLSFERSSANTIYPQTYPFHDNTWLTSTIGSFHQQQIIYINHDFLHQPWSETDFGLWEVSFKPPGYMWSAKW